MYDYGKKLLLIICKASSAFPREFAWKCLKQELNVGHISTDQARLINRFYKIYTEREDNAVKEKLGL